jgi:hypothetical protein
VQDGGQRNDGENDVAHVYLSMTENARALLLALGNVPSARRWPSRGILAHAGDRILPLNHQIESGLMLDDGAQCTRHARAWLRRIYPRTIEFLNRVLLDS